MTATTRPDRGCMPGAAPVTATSANVMKRRLRTLCKDIGTFFQHIRYGLLEPTNLGVTDRERQRDEPASRKIDAALQHVEVEQVAKQRVDCSGVGRRLDRAADGMRAHQRTEPRELQP